MLIIKVVSCAPVLVEIPSWTHKPLSLVMGFIIKDGVVQVEEALSAQVRAFQQKGRDAVHVAHGVLRQHELPGSNFELAPVENLGLQKLNHCQELVPISIHILGQLAKEDDWVECPVVDLIIVAGGKANPAH